MQIEIPVTEQSQPSEARREAINLAAQAGFPEHDVANAALVVTEAATNLVKHALGGRLLMRVMEEQGDPCFEVLSLDQGPGIADVPGALRDGFSTVGSSGTGLGAIRRAAADFDIYSQPGKGTALVARLRPGGAPARCPYEIGVVHQPKPEESVCGDGWLFAARPDGWVCAVVDGLGHGAMAAQAAQEALMGMRAMIDRTASPLQLLEAAHEAAKGTRGAALGVAVLNTKEGVVRFVGVGNISAVVLDGDQRRSLVSHNGILGAHLVRRSESMQRWSSQNTLVMHSDGLSIHWDPASYPGLLARDPSVMAGLLYRDWRRRDDVTVVVVRERRG